MQGTLLNARDSAIFTAIWGMRDINASHCSVLSHSPRRFYDNLPEIRGKLGEEYDISISLTDLPFHPQAFPAHAAVKMVEGRFGV